MLLGTWLFDRSIRPAEGTQHNQEATDDNEDDQLNHEFAPHAAAIPAASIIASIRNTEAHAHDVIRTQAAKIHNHQVLIALPLLLGHTARPTSDHRIATGEQLPWTCDRLTPVSMSSMGP